MHGTSAVSGAAEAGHPVGEAWLTSVDCAVEGQSSATLGDMTRVWPKEFGADKPGEFPLLMKFLFPREWLSVQVHPNDAEAQAIGQPRGKNECWYVLSAEPGAKLALGFREEMTPEEIERAIHEGTLESKLKYVPVKAGDMVYVDAGTIHAIGPGMVVLETQQYSDTTYRLYDYGRPRELHLKDGLAVTKPQTGCGSGRAGRAGRIYAADQLAVFRGGSVLGCGGEFEGSGAPRTHADSGGAG